MTLQEITGVLELIEQLYPVIYKANRLENKNYGEVEAVIKPVPGGYDMRVILKRFKVTSEGICYDTREIPTSKGELRQIISKYKNIVKELEKPIDEPTANEIINRSKK